MLTYSYLINHYLHNITTIFMTTILWNVINKNGIRDEPAAMLGWVGSILTLLGYNLLGFLNNQGYTTLASHHN